MHKLNNYGSVLQAYALQSTVNKLGFRGEIIDYSIHYTQTVLLGYATHAYREQGLHLLATLIFHYMIEVIQQRTGKLTRYDSHRMPRPEIFDEF
jgi:hypothetical protein